MTRPADDGDYPGGDQPNAVLGQDSAMDDRGSDGSAGVAAILPPDAIERLRRSGIRINREGEFQHEGQPVTHEGLRRAFFRWLDRLEDGRTILRLDAERFVHLDVEDTPLVARAARIDGDAVVLALSDGAAETLNPATLRIDRAGVMRCWVRGGRLAARLTTSAATVVAALIDDRFGGPVLRLGAREFPLGGPPATEP